MKRYPPALLVELATAVFEFCGELGFLSFAEQRKNGAGQSISSIINEAWNAFAADAETFPEHEVAALAALARDCNSTT